MGTSEKMPLSVRIKQLEEEIDELKIHLQKYHLIETPEQDFDIKSLIINKQNEMIELLIKQRDENKTL
jgi:hypothetical protein